MLSQRNIVIFEQDLLRYYAARSPRLACVRRHFPGVRVLMCLRMPRQQIVTAGELPHGQSGPGVLHPVSQGTGLIGVPAEILDARLLHRFAGLSTKTQKVRARSMY
jgi:hypothetical protein